MNRKLSGIALILAVTVLGSGCQTTSQGSKTYTRAQAQTQMQVFYATVLSVADVTIQTEETGAGAATGGIVGGIVGSTMGGGKGTRLTTTAGALAGAAAGSAIEKEKGRKAAIEIEVEVDDGRIMVIVQEKDDEFAVGDRVRIVRSQDGRMRVRQ
jgi:outer membrane lipoprotein SlyB